ncbi:hypothetical protein [Flavobacterium silvaticum]|uniref:DoxX family protein n=1 Tax=Flavobacterium silvaticum TaxID=1852020 RepID=A0A972JF54_9FLAO|nr:hypothetical protein [Flavobacterium silvaticum]NMH26876.1 hypothetical protein [Flavobacterium silvaticum]
MTTAPYTGTWPQWQKIAFRFCFIYFGLYILSTSFSDFGTLMTYLTKFQVLIADTLVYGFNDHILHFKKELVPLAGSGDTSYGWVQLILYLILAFVGTIIWSILDYKRTNYRKLDFVLWNSIRYYVCFMAFSYGIIKVFLMQMSFPLLSQLATPLGDFLPMRLSWMFIGYSNGYQFFSGLMELTVFGLLLFRRTVLLGLFIGLGVFVNVLLLNLCYDIPVKLFSAHLVAMCLFLISPDLTRLYHFFICNRTTAISAKYHFSSARKWMRVTRIGLKVIFFVMIGLVFKESYDYYAEKPPKPSLYGVYDVDTYVRNRDTIPVLAKDSIIWKDVIFDRFRMVSVNSTDTVLRQNYRRGYFYYKQDSLAGTLDCYKWDHGDSTYLWKIKYRKEKDRIYLQYKSGADSIRISLRDNHRKFQLERREFHWLSESNR